MLTVDRATCIVFFADGLPPRGSDHTLPLYIFVGCFGHLVPSILQILSHLPRRFEIVHIERFWVC